MKILFIAPYPTEGQSNRFRVEQYLPDLAASGVECLVRPFYTSNFRKLLQTKGHYLKKAFFLVVFSISRLADVFRAIRYDVVFVHREAFPTNDYLFEMLFRITGKKIIYDFDDSVFLNKPAKTRKAVTVSDHIIAGNQFLKNYAVKFNKNVTVLPTCIDMNKYTPEHKSGGKKTVVIGWMGSPTTAEYLYDLDKVFEYLSKKYNNVEFRAIGAKFGSGLDFPLINKDWSLDSEVEELRSFDIGVMPMPDNEWTRGKCAFKIIQYMAVGIPAVASPVGMNNEVIQDGVNGYLASTENQWCEKLSKLIESFELRQIIGESGRKTVEERYAIKRNAPKLIDTIKNIQ